MKRKKTFYMDHGNFCYKKMPPWLKNAGGTDQRLVNKIFQNQIKRNVEVYVDDMVLKSTNETCVLQDVEETLKML